MDLQISLIKNEKAVFRIETKRKIMGTGTWVLCFCRCSYTSSDLREGKTCFLGKTLFKDGRPFATLGFYVIIGFETLGPSAQ